MIPFRLFLLAASVSISLCACNEKIPESTVRIHSHNDYEQPKPFWAAYRAGARSIEADIWLQDGAILVAHDADKLDAERSLKQLYLNPLDSLIKAHNGKLSADTGYRIQLMIDIKSPTNPCLDTLVILLSGYPNLVKSSSVQFVLSGNKPAVEQFGNYPSFILYDGLPWEEYPAAITPRVPMLSANLQKYTKWKADGPLPNEDKAALEEVIKATHAKGKTIRFWGAPDNELAWTTLRELGVDYINTDHLEELQQFLKM